MSVKRILVLGGYGNFGKRICEQLCRYPDVEILVSGRSKFRAEQLCDDLIAMFPGSEFRVCGNRLTACPLDIDADDFPASLSTLAVDLVIHTGGPFQGQGYRVAQSCIQAGSHYIDLADDRRFVCDFSTLNDEAEGAGVLLVTGASSVPGLSSVVVEHYLPRFNTLDSVDIAIAPGNRAERGKATVSGVLSYIGRPLVVFEEGDLMARYGWMSSCRRYFGSKVGFRHLANVDVPDLELFPARYPVRQRVSFQAGLELPLLHHSMVAMAWLVRKRWIKSWQPLTSMIVAVSNWFSGFGSDAGAMRVDMSGCDGDQGSVKISWLLTAEQGVGPYIPTLSALIVTDKLIRGELTQRGALPCLGMYSLDDFKTWADRYNLTYSLMGDAVVSDTGIANKSGKGAG